MNASPATGQEPFDTSAAARKTSIGLHETVARNHDFRYAGLQSAQAER